MHRIAVIDDHEPVNNMLVELLHEVLPGCMVDQFYESETALKAIDESDYDLVVSDVDLGPGSDKYGGVKIAKALDTKRIPLLVISGSPEYAVQQAVFRALDAWDYLQKPIAEADFSVQVRRAIAFRQTATSSQTAGPISGVFPLVPELVIRRGERKPVQWRTKNLSLSMSQIDIVEHLASRAGQVVSFDDLYKFIASGKNRENLRVKISEIRAEFKSEDDGFDRIKGVPLAGYVWRTD